MRSGPGLADTVHQVPDRRIVLIAPAWPYANGPRHIGHVVGFAVPADVLARFERLRGSRVLMASGTDEHGTPITYEADKEGIPPREFVDRNTPSSFERRSTSSSTCPRLASGSRRGSGPTTTGGQTSASTRSSSCATSSLAPSRATWTGVFPFRFRAGRTTPRRRFTSGSTP